MSEIVEVRVPKLSLDAVEATFLAWIAADGQAVVEDQPLYSVETDKVETEVTASASGILRYGTAEPDMTYAVGTVLGVIEVTR